MITVTDKAAVKVKQLLEAENATELALRVAVRPGGCSGYSYEMFFDGEFAADDMVQTFGDVKVVVLLLKSLATHLAMHGGENQAKHSCAVSCSACC